MLVNAQMTIRKGDSRRSRPPLPSNPHASASRCIHESPSMSAARVPPAFQEGSCLWRADGGRPHRRRLWDEISTVKTTYRLLRLAPMLLIRQSTWPTTDTTLQAPLAQFLPVGFWAHCDSVGGSVARTTGNLIQRTSGSRHQSTGDLVWISTRSSNGVANNMVAQDHRFPQRLVNLALGFSSFRAARRTLQGYEAMHRIQKGQSKGSAQGRSAQHRVVALACGLVA
jgi:hypothetical protein